jgi:hypothetical protein
MNGLKVAVRITVRIAGRLLNNSSILKVNESQSHLRTIYILSNVWPRVGIVEYLIQTL